MVGYVDGWLVQDGSRVEAQVAVDALDVFGSGMAVEADELEVEADELEVEADELEVEPEDEDMDASFAFILRTLSLRRANSYSFLSFLSFCLSWHFLFLSFSFRASASSESRHLLHLICIFFYGSDILVKPHVH